MHDIIFNNVKSYFLKYYPNCTIPEKLKQNFIAYKKVTNFPNFKVSLCRRSKYIVYGHTIIHKHLTSEIINDSHTVLTARDPLRTFFLPRSFSYNLDGYYSFIYSLLYSDDSYLKKYILNVIDILKKTKARFFLGHSTIDPINVIWFFASRAMGLTTICFQHGLFPRNAPSELYEKNIIDHYMCINDNQRTFLKKNIPNKKIINLSYRNVKYFYKLIFENIIFVGQDIERYGKILQKEEEVFIYIDLRNKLKENFKNLNFLYKLHPSEKLSKNLKWHLKKNKIKIYKYDKKVRSPLYIGFSSTFLMQKASDGFLSIQIFNNKNYTNNYFKLGFCLTVLQSACYEEAIIKILKQKKISMPRLMFDKLTSNYLRKL